jgi:hypothetical protein
LNGNLHNDDQILPQQYTYSQNEINYNPLPNNYNRMIYTIPNNQINNVRAYSNYLPQNYTQQIIPSPIQRNILLENSTYQNKLPAINQESYNNRPDIINNGGNYIENSNILSNVLNSNPNTVTNKISKPVNFLTQSREMARIRYAQDLQKQIDAKKLEKLERKKREEEEDKKLEENFHKELKIRE